jgi:prepilin-type N-terminal cleavage/methylation domain-containing protein
MLMVRKQSLVRTGFTLMEVAVAAAIFAILAAVVFATVHGATGSTTKRIGDAAAQLREITSAINKFDTATGDGSPEKGRLPLQISHLTDTIVDVSSANCPRCRNSCGFGPAPPAQSLYSSENENGWRNRGGPFYSRNVIPGIGFPLSIGFVRDTLVREPVTPTPMNGTTAIRAYGVLKVRIDNVSFADAQELNAIVDADNSATTGTIRWTATPDGEGMLSSIFWTIPIGGC